MKVSSQIVFRKSFRSLGLLVSRSLVELVYRHHGEEDGRQFPANQSVANEPLRFLVENLRVAGPISRERELGSRFQPSMDKAPEGAVSEKEGVVARLSALRKANGARGFTNPAHRLLSLIDRLANVFANLVKRLGNTIVGLCAQW